jgi:preprotein translocase subunit SecF
LDFVGKRYWFLVVSMIAILPGVVFLIIAPGLRAGIDFTGGSTVTVEFEDDTSQEDVRQVMVDFGETDAVVQNFGDNTFFIRTKELDEARKDALLDLMESRLSPGGVQILSFDLVSPVVARKIVVNGFWMVLAAAVGIFVYIWWAFRNVPSPYRYGLAAIIALVHDTLIVVGIFAILGELAGTEVNSMFLFALLTVIGYSVNDTIVVFDRLRENVLLYPNRSFADTVNLSISETISRSLNTSLTVLFTLLALILFGGQTIKTFLLVLLIGVVAGTYSSIAVASQVLVAWEYGDLRRALRLGRSTQATAAE